MKPLLRIALFFALATFGMHGTAMAQDASSDSGDGAETVESEDVADAQAALEDLRTAKAPDGSVDYEEVHRIRVLERVLIPGIADDAPYRADDPMDLSGDAAISILRGDADAAQVPRGLQRHSEQIMRDALAQVQQILESSGNLAQPFGIDCLSQPAVQKQIAVFTTSSTGTIKTWLKRLERWRPVHEKALAEEQAPLDLVYLAMIESGFKTRVRSPASAAGMWQFMAGTGTDMGLRIDEWVDERYDPIKAAHAAARYLHKQYRRYHSWPLAMAAYNGGPGTVNVAIARYNTNDYFKLVQYGAMFDETRRYVPRILAAAVIGHNPAAFGFGGLTPEPPFVFDTVEVPGGTPLKILAEAAGTKEDAIRELNPELLRDAVPPGQNYMLRIPQGSHRTFVERFDKVSQRFAKLDKMTLRFGETVETLGAEIGVAPRVLRSLNNLGANGVAPYGATVYVPEGTKRNGPTGEPPLAFVTPEAFDLPGTTRVFYEVQPGDTLREIANAFGLLPTQIAVWNELDATARLRPSMFLQIFVTSGVSHDDVRYYDEAQVHAVVRGSEEHQAIIEARKNANKKSAKNAAKDNGKKSTKDGDSEYVIHVVAKGDSLAKIAKKYKVTVDSLRKLNRMKEGASLRVGQKIKVKKK